MVQSPIQLRFVDNEVAAALIRNGLPYDSPLREKLNSEAVIIGPPGEGYVRMRDDRGELVSIPGRITQLRADPAYRAFFPDPPRIGSGEEQIRENFERIARGEVHVMK